MSNDIWERIAKNQAEIDAARQQQANSALADKVAVQKITIAAPTVAPITTQKRDKVADALAAKTASIRPEARNEIGYQLQNWINPLKSVINTFLPESLELQKYELDKTTGREYRLDEDTNVRMEGGRFNEDTGLIKEDTDWTREYVTPEMQHKYNLMGTHEDPIYVKDANDNFTQLDNRYAVKDWKSQQDYADAIAYYEQKKKLAIDEAGRIRDMQGKLVTGKTGQLYDFAAADGVSRKAGITLGAYKDPVTGRMVKPDAAIRYVPGKGFVDSNGVIGENYGWAPGAKGVDVTKPYTSELFTDEDNIVLEGLKHQLHTLAGTTTNKKEPWHTEFSKQQNKDYGSGKSEYYVPSKVDTMGDAKRGEALVKKLRESDEYINSLYNYETKDLGEAPNEIAQTILNIPGALAKGVVDLGDTLQEMATYIPQEIYNKMNGTNVDIDLLKDEDKEKVKQTINHLTGYLSEFDEADQNKARRQLEGIGFDIAKPETYKNLVSAEGSSKIGKAIDTMLQNPSMTVENIAPIIGAGLGLGAVTKGAGLLGGVIAPRTTAALQRLTTTNYDKIQNVIKTEAKAGTLTPARAAELEGQITFADKAMKLAVGSNMSNADFMNRMNADATAYRENMDADANGDRPGMGLEKIVSAAVMNRIGSAWSAYNIKSILKPDGTIKEGTKTILNNKLVKFAVEMGKGPFKEAAQEGVDSIIEAINQNYGTDAYKGKTLGEVLSDKSNDILFGALAGAAGGAHMAAVGSTGNLKDMYKESSEKRAEAKHNIAEAKKVSDRVKTLETNVGDFNAYTKEMIQENTEVEEFDANGKVESVFETPHNLKVDSANAAEYEAKLESQRDKVIQTLYTVDPRTKVITGLNENAINEMTVDQIEEKAAKIDKWLTSYENEYKTKPTTIPTVNQEVLDSTTDVEIGQLSNEQKRELALSVYTARENGMELSPKQKEFVESGKIYTKAMTALESEIGVTYNSQVAELVATLRDDSKAYVNEAIGATKDAKNNVAKAQMKLDAANTAKMKVEEGITAAGDNVSPELLAKLDEAVAEVTAAEKVLAEAKKAMNLTVKGGSVSEDYVNDIAGKINERDAAVEALNKMSEEELTNHYKTELTAHFTRDGKLAPTITAGVIEEIAAKTASRRKEINSSYKFGGAVEPDVKYDGLVAEVENKKIKKDKTIDSRTVTGTALLAISKKGFSEKEVSAAEIEYKETDSKTIHRVFKTLDDEFKNVLTVMNKIEEAVNTETAKELLGEIFEEPAMKNQDGVVLMVNTIAAIHEAVGTETRARQNIDNGSNEDKDGWALHKDEYMASYSNLATQIGKNFMTAKQIKPASGSPEKHLEMYRNIGVKALQIAKDAGLINITDGALWTVLSKYAVDEKGGKLTSKAGSNIDISTTEKDLVTGENVTVILNDKGVNVVDIGEKKESQNVARDKRGNFQEYKNDTGELVSRINKLLIPNNLQVPSTEASTNVVVAPTVDPNPKLLETIKELQNAKHAIKGTWRAELKKIKDVVDGEYEGNLDKYLSGNGKWVAQMLGIDKYNTGAQLLAANDSGVSMGIKDALRGLIDNLDVLTEEDNGELVGFHYTYQMDVNSRITVRETVGNIQTDKVISRWIVSSLGAADGYEIGAEYLRKTQVEMLNELGFKAKATNKKDAEAEYDNAIAVIMGKKATKEDSTLIRTISSMIGADSTIQEMSEQLNSSKEFSKINGRKTIKGIALIDGFKMMRATGGVKTNFAVETDAKSSGVMNVLLGTVGFDIDKKEGERGIQDVLASLGLQLNNKIKLSKRDAYNLLQDKVREVLGLVGDVNEDKKFLIDELHSKEIEHINALDKLGIDTRDLAKYPVMTWFYTAGTQTIINDLAQKLLEQVIRKAVSNDKMALDHIASILGKDSIQVTDVAAIKVGSAEHRTIMDAYQKIGALYEKQLDAAFPGVNKFKNVVKDIFYDVQKLGGEYANSIHELPNMYPGTKSSRANLAKEMQFNVNLEDDGVLLEDKPQLKKDLADDQLLTANKLFANYTSLIPLLTQSSDFAELEYSLREMFRKNKGNTELAPTTAHDAIFTPLKFIDNGGEQAYNEAVVSIAKNFDIVQSMIKNAEETLVRMKAAVGTTKEGDDKVTLEKNINTLEGKIAKWNEGNKARIELKQKLLTSEFDDDIQVEVFGGDAEIKYSKGTEVVEEVKRKEPKVTPKGLLIKTAKQAASGVKFDTETTLANDVTQEIYQIGFTDVNGEAVSKTIYRENGFTFEEYYGTEAIKKALGANPQGKLTETEKEQVVNYYSEYAKLDKVNAMVMDEKVAVSAEQIVTEMLDAVEANNGILVGFNSDAFDIPRLRKMIEGNAELEERLDKVKSIDMRKELGEYRVNSGNGGTDSDWTKLKGKQLEYAIASGVVPDPNKAHDAKYDVEVLSEMVNNIATGNYMDKIADPVRAAKDIMLQQAVNEFKKSADIDVFVNSLVRYEQEGVEQVREKLTKIGKVSFIIDPSKESKIDTMINDKGEVRREITIGKEKGVGATEVEQMLEVIGHELEHAVTTSLIEELAAGKGTADNKKAYKYIVAVLNKVQSQVDKGVQFGNDSRLARVMSAPKEQQVAEMVAVVRGEINGAEQLAKELSEKFGIVKLISDVIKSIKQLIAAVRAAMTDETKVVFNTDNLNVDELIRAVEQIHRSAMVDEAISDNSTYSFGKATDKVKTATIDKKQIAEKLIAQLSKIADGKVPAINKIINKIKDC